MPESKHPISADIDENTPGVLYGPSLFERRPRTPTLSLVSGHDFSRAEPRPRKCTFALTPPNPAPSPTPSHHGTPQTDYHLYEVIHVRKNRHHYWSQRRLGLVRYPAISQWRRHRYRRFAQPSPIRL